MPRAVSMRPVAGLCLAVVLGACSGEHAAQTPVRDPDPMVSTALAAPLMTDPDLAALNLGGAALSGDGILSAAIPIDSAGPEAASRARSEARALAGGSLDAVPATSGNKDSLAAQTAMASFRRAFGDVACREAASYTFLWAARMPEPFAIYPRGHVQEAAGADADGCRLRAVNFRTPVAVTDVLSYYATRARKAGFSVDHRSRGDAHALSGRLGQSGYVIFVRTGTEDQTEVDLLFKGG